MSYITPGLSYTWINEGQVLTYKATSVSVYSMIEWAQHILETLSNWPENKPIQILFDLSHPKVSVPYMILTNRDIFNIGITDLGRMRVQQILINKGNLFGRLAVLLPSSTSGMVVRNNSRSSTPAVESRMFTDYSAAIEWVADVNMIAQKFGQTRTLNINEEVILGYKSHDSNRTPLQPSYKLGLVYNLKNLLVEIPQKQSTTVGRQDFDTDIVGVNAYTVSRLHVQFDFSEATPYLIDLESTNGTFVNGVRIQPFSHTPLNIGDEIRLGSIVVRLDYFDF